MAMAYNYADIMQNQLERLEAEGAQRAAELEAARINEDPDAVHWAAQRILELDSQRNALAVRANQFAAQQRVQPQRHKYGLSPEEIEVARNFTQDPKLSNDDKEKLYAEQRARYRHARATGAYRDDQGRVTR
jgi:hypothetical protein